MRRLWHWVFGHTHSTIGSPFCDCKYGEIQFRYLKRKQ